MKEDHLNMIIKLWHLHTATGVKLTVVTSAT